MRILAIYEARNFFASRFWSFWANPRPPKTSNLLNHWVHFIFAIADFWVKIMVSEQLKWRSACEIDISSLKIISQNCWVCIPTVIPKCWNKCENCGHCLASRFRKNPSRKTKEFEKTTRTHIQSHPSSIGRRDSQLNPSVGTQSTSNPHTAIVSLSGLVSLSSMRDRNFSIEGW